MKIFISWSGRRSKQIANATNAFLKDVFQAVSLEVFVSTRDIRAATKWIEAINTALTESVFGILCLTPENLSAPWLLFEGGALSKTAGTGSVCPYLYELEFSDVSVPLSQFNAIKVDKTGTRELVDTLNGRFAERRILQPHLNILFDYYWPIFEKELGTILASNSDVSIDLIRSQQGISEMLSKARNSKWLNENKYLEKVVLDSAHQFEAGIRHCGPCYDVPLMLYPTHLVSLLKAFKPVVKAVAIVDEVEEFWPHKEGEEIRKATTSDSTRVFVFRRRDHLKANISVLLKHSKQYNVSALSFKRLAVEYSAYVQDFSIIGNSSHPLLAYYVESSPHERGAMTLKMIRFSANPDELTRHDEALTGIIGIATPIDKLLDESNESKIDELLDAVFTPEFKEFGKRHVEMSSYIDVIEYDKHEEEHAYFSEMMDGMLAIIRQYRNDDTIVARILELGAGTGIFTRRLARLAKVDILGLDSDWACLHILRQNMAALAMAMEQIGSRFEALYQDTRQYNPPGKFRFVVSSFADHHIHFLDKVKYFRNIRRNLENDGIFIVGDEFLPEHDEKDDGARKQALESYHQHIISVAESNGYTHLVKLEQDALMSGLKGLGDYKIACGQYERLIVEAGLKIKVKEKIGPKAPDDIGGIYVYALTK